MSRVGLNQCVIDALLLRPGQQEVPQSVGRKRMHNARGFSHNARYTSVRPSRIIALWRDDDLAFTREWGFYISRIERPVAVWQGGEDRMVPFAHGHWLADHIPNARVHLDPQQGHLSLALAALDQIIDELLNLAP